MKREGKERERERKRTRKREIMAAGGQRGLDDVRRLPHSDAAGLRLNSRLLEESKS